MFRRTGYLAASIVAYCCTCSAMGQGEDPAEMVNSLFGEKLKQVAATRDTADDLALAEQLLNLARNSREKPALLAVLGQHAYELSSKDPQGYGLAVEALKLLAENAPEKRAEYLEAASEVQQRWFAVSRGADKDEVGRQLLSTLIHLAAAHQAAADLDDSVKTYRRALGVATAIRSPDKEVVRAAMDAVVQRQQLLGQIDTLQKRLTENAKDQVACDELLRLYIVELDNPAEALKYAKFSEDAEFTQRVGWAAQPPEKLTEDQALSVGNWYRKLAAEAAGSSKRLMLTHAQRFLQRYLAAHGTDDLYGKKAELDVAEIAQQLAKLGGPAAVRSGAEAAGVATPVVQQWIDVLGLINPQSPDVAGLWEKSTNGVLFHGGEGTRPLPYEPTGSYAFDVEATRLDGGSGFGVYLPAAGNATVLMIQHKDNSGGLEMVDLQGVWSPKNPTHTTGVRVTTGQRNSVTGKVVINGETVTIEADWNGRPLVRWSGAGERLTVYKPTRLRVPTATAFTAGSKYLVHHFRIKPLDSSARSDSDSADRTTRVSASDRGNSADTPAPVASPDPAALTRQDSNGLLGYWNFDESDGLVAKDASGNGHDGALKNSPERVKGVIGKAVRFDGHDDHIDLGNPPELDFTGPITMAAWIRPEGLGGKANDIMSILAHGPTLAPRKADVFLRLKLHKYEAGSWTGPENTVSFEAPEEDLERWVHIAGVYDGQAWRLYRNGVQVAAESRPAGAVPVDHPWTIGAGQGGKTRFFKGAIDEVRVYNRALTAEELKTLASIHLPPGQRGSGFFGVPSK